VTFHDDAQEVIANDPEMTELWEKAYPNRPIKGASERAPTAP
jgi:hypothetical protein